MNIVKNKLKITKTMSFRLTVGGLAIFLSFILIVIGVTIGAFTNYVNNRAITQNTVLSEQVLFNYETYFKNIINVSNSIQDEIYNLSNLHIAVNKENEYFDSIISIKNEIVHIGLYDQKGNYLSGDGKNSVVDANINDGWFLAARNNELIDNFSAVAKVGESYVVTLSRLAQTDKGQDDCILKMDLDFTSIVNSIYQVDFGTNGHIVIYDKNYELVYTSSTSYGPNEIALLKQNVLGTSQVTIDGHDFVITQYTISNTTWRVAVFSNFDEVSHAIERFIWIVCGVAAVVYFLFAFFTIYLVHSMTKPLRTLQQGMIEVKSYDYLNYLPINIKGTKEVEDLNESYNAMMLQIRKLMNNVIEEQNNQRKSEFKALTNQINPHFLYNTLDSIIYLIEENKNEDAQTMVLALSKFFRISISKGRTIIPLKDEVEHIKNYLIIQKLRYKDAFNFVINILNNCENFEVIKLILQPIVENAIYHGIKDKDNGFINVNCYLEDEFLKLSVKDNGYGISDYKIKEIVSSFDDPEVYNGVGLKNVYQRLKIYYGNKADVQIDSVLDEGTTITLIIPLEEIKHENK